MSSRNTQLVCPLTVLLLIAAIACRADTLYVSYADRTGNTRPNKVEFFDTATGADLGVFASTGLNGPAGVALDGAGNLYVANRVLGNIMKFTPEGVGSVFASVGSSDPWALAFDRNGNLYMSNWGYHTISKITPEGVSSTFASAGVNFPTGLAVDSANNVYVANVIDNRIDKITPHGARSVFATDLMLPYGLAVDEHDNLFAAGASGLIKKYTPDGVGSVFSDSSSFPLLELPFSLAFDSGGNLYAADYNNGFIAKFTADGAGSVFAYTGANSPWFIAIQPVPEPSVCALLSFGFIAILVRRSRIKIATITA